MTNNRWITVPGVVERGYKVASGQATDSPYPGGALEMQLPFFAKLGLDLFSFYRATLNISIRPYTFTVRNPEFTFRQVEWTTRHPPEDFSFSRCQVSFDGARYEGWVYYPHPETKIRNFQDPSIIEVVAAYIPNINYGDRVEITVNADAIRLEKNQTSTDSNI